MLPMGNLRVNQFVNVSRRQETTDGNPLIVYWRGFSKYTFPGC